MTQMPSTPFMQHMAQPPSVLDDAGLTMFAPHGSDDAASYDIRYSLERHYFQMRLFGLWDMATFERFSLAYMEVLTALAARGGVTHALVDASAFSRQVPDVSDRFPLLVAAAPHRPEQRTACVVPALVNRVQARASGDIINSRYFRTAEDAIDWLFSDEA